MKRATGSSEDNDYFKPSHKEEHFILRIMDELVAERVRQNNKNGVNPLKIEFSSPRNATVTIVDPPMTLPARLVDLPCIIESHKTSDHKKYFKIGDICQMLVVGDVPEDVKKRSEDEVIWPDGLTNPLKHCRKRRFRKRASKKVVEDIEKEVKRLLEADAKAMNVDFTVREEGVTEDQQSMAATPSGNVSHDEEFAESSSSDSELALNLEDDLLQMMEEEDEERQELLLLSNAIKELNDEIEEIQTKLNERKSQLEQQVNPIVKKRIEESIARLEEEIEAKQQKKATLNSQLEKRNEVDLD